MDRRPHTLVSRSVSQQGRTKSNAPWGGVSVFMFDHVCVHSAARQTGSLKTPTEKEEGKEREREITVGEGLKKY